MGDILQVNWRYAVTKPDREQTEAEAAAAKYKLRGQAGPGKRRPDNEDRLGRKRSPRTKCPASKMSKYRRKTANARERMRMGEINVAYDRLKDTIPLPSGPSLGIGKGKCEKLTKINLLHIAINYIRTLQRILDSGEEMVDIVPEKLILNPFRDPEAGEVEESDEEDLDKAETDSPDSGIQESEGEGDAECPDWTELSSTLDMGSQISEPAGKKENVNKGVILSKPARCVMSNNTNFKLHNFITNSENKVTKCKPVTLTSRSPNMPEVRARKAASVSELQGGQPQPHQDGTKRENQSDNLLPPTLSMEQDEFFNELNSSMDSFDGINDIDFCYDDPFKVF